jgi:N-acetylmuramoyl-L-alanine amidase
MMRALLLWLASAWLLSACGHTLPTAPQRLLPDLRSVEDWGGTRVDGPYTARARAHRPVRLTLHHAGVPFGRERDPVAHLRQLQRWSREMRGWADIPYHYIVDLDGVVYEGRDVLLAGDTNTAYDPSGHALVMVLGNFEEVMPNAAQIEATARIFAALARRFDISTDTLASHRDYARDTVCPGQHLYAFITTGALKTRVDALLTRP